MGTPKSANMVNQIYIKLNKEKFGELSVTWYAFYAKYKD